MAIIQHIQYPKLALEYQQIILLTLIQKKEKLDKLNL